VPSHAIRRRAVLSCTWQNRDGAKMSGVAESADTKRLNAHCQKNSYQRLALVVSVRVALSGSSGGGIRYASCGGVQVMVHLIEKREEDDTSRKVEDFY
jgi:hypothetical protein